MSVVCPQCNTPIPAAAIQNKQATCAECGYEFSVAKLRRNPRRGKAPLLSFLSTTPYIHTRTAGDTLILTRTRVSQNLMVKLVGIGSGYMIAIILLSGLPQSVIFSAPILLVGTLVTMAIAFYVIYSIFDLFGSTTLRINRSTITLKHNFLPERDLTFPSALATHIEVEENNHDLFDIVARLSSGKYALLLKNLPDVTQANAIRQQIENHLDRLDMRHLEDTTDETEKSLFQFGTTEKQKQTSKGQGS